MRFYCLSLRRIYSRLTSMRSSVKSFFQKLFPSLDRANTVIAIFAFLISLGSLYVSWQNNSVDSADKQYKFWHEMNVSYKEQQGYLSKLRPLLLLRVDKAAYVYRKIKDQKLSCNSLDKIYPHPNLSQTDPVSHYENDELSTMQTTALELQPFANSLSPVGWNEFLSNNNFATQWWLKFAWASMQLSFFPTQFQMKCAMSERLHGKELKAVKVSKKSLNTFNEDIHLTFSDLTYIGENESPSLKSITVFEGENEVGPVGKQSTIKSFYTTSVFQKFNAIVSWFMYLD